MPPSRPLIVYLHTSTCALTLSNALAHCLTADGRPVLQEKAATPLLVPLQLGSCPMYLLTLESRL